MFKEYLRGPNTPEDVYPCSPVFAEPCQRTSRGAFRNLGGWWVRERGDERHTTTAKVKA